MDDLGPLPKVKKYDDQFRKAKLDISNALFELKKKHGLSEVQFFGILSAELSDLASSWMQSERRPLD